MDDTVNGADKPFVHLEFNPDGSTSLHASGVNFMQLFAAAKLIEIHGEQVFMGTQIEEAQKAGRIIVPATGRQQRGRGIS
jgi:hypothetical protein